VYLLPKHCGTGCRRAPRATQTLISRHYLIPQRFPLELAFWVLGLTYLFFLPVMPAGTQFSFCLFRTAGFGACPGCGLGDAISLLMHGKIVASFQSHPLGLFALPVIFGRIVRLIRSHTIIRKDRIHAKAHAVAPGT